ncbi:unnamed protein product [Closterium sp. Naga37s-1]|nr:unnamed protein product [Closterium sp. Naga37s-1]
MLCGPPGSGQVYLVQALLHRLEHLPVHSMSLPSLLTDPSSHSPEEALVRVVAEARRGPRCILFLPHADLWWRTAQPVQRAVLRMLLSDLPPSLPVLLLAFANCSLHQLPSTLRPTPMASHASTAAAAAAAAAAAEAAAAEAAAEAWGISQCSSSSGGDGRPAKKRRVLPSLPLAPPLQRTQTEAEKAAAEAAEEHCLRRLRMCLRDESQEVQQLDQNQQQQQGIEQESGEREKVHAEGWGEDVEMVPDSYEGVDEEEEDETTGAGHNDGGKQEGLRTGFGAEQLAAPAAVGLAGLPPGSSGGVASRGTGVLSNRTKISSAGTCNHSGGPRYTEPPSDAVTANAIGADELAPDRVGRSDADASDAPRGAEAVCGISGDSSGGGAIKFKSLGELTRDEKGKRVSMHDVARERVRVGRAGAEGGTAAAAAGAAAGASGAGCVPGMSALGAAGVAGAASVPVVAAAGSGRAPLHDGVGGSGVGADTSGLGDGPASCAPRTVRFDEEWREEWEKEKRAVKEVMEQVLCRVADRTDGLMVSQLEEVYQRMCMLLRRKRGCRDGVQLLRDLERVVD